MRNGLLLLAGIGLLAGCSVELPGFAGREGNAAGMYTFRAPPPPEPQQVPLRQAEAERALHGVILRVRGETPSQGYYSAALRPIGTGPDAAGILSFEFVAGSGRDSRERRCRPRRRSRRRDGPPG